MVSLLGVPIFWRDILVFLSGLFLVLVSLGPTILKKLQTKSKVRKEKSPVKELKFSETKLEGDPLGQEQFKGHPQE